MKTRIEFFGKRQICIGGIGKMFYQDGFPISMSVIELQKSGVEVSIFHVADECLQNGWSPITVIKKLTEDFADDKTVKFEKDKLEKFCNSSYEDQREMIFQYLFSTSSQKVINGESEEVKTMCLQKIYPLIAK